MNTYNDQDITISGRWLLTYACGIGSYFDLPWLNGLLCAVYIGITAVFITELFNIENPIVIGLTALILAACPSTTETLFFEYTADGYFLALMLCAFSAYLSAKGKTIWHFAGSGVLICASLAIYQAYISFAIVLCACWMIMQLLDGRYEAKEAWRWVGRHVIIYALAMGVYYALWQIILAATGQTAAHYQGIDQIGKLQLSTMLGGARKSVTNLLLFFLEWNILEHPITLYASLNILFVLAFIGVFTSAISKSRVYKKASTLLTALTFLAACIPAISIWSFLSDSVIYRPMMMHSVCVFYVFALVLADKYVTSVFRTGVGLLAAVMVFNFGVMANIAYSLQHECYEKSYYLGTKLMEDIEENKVAGVQKVAFVGARKNETSIENTAQSDRIHILSALLESDLLLDHAHTYHFLQYTFDMELASVSNQKLAELEAREDVQAMPSWTEADSIQIIDDILVIKLGEIQ